jgi:hypothetical protein
MMGRQALRNMRPDRLAGEASLRAALKPAPKPEPAQAPRLIAALDLGQVQDYSALAALERREAPKPAGLAGRRHEYTARHLRRWPLGTPYTQIVADVAALMASGQLAGAPLVIDRTGVGRAVVDLFRTARVAARLVPVTIHGGHAVTPTPDGGYNVPKVDLAAVLQALAQRRPEAGLHVHPSLPYADALLQEILTFSVKVNLATGRETFEAWRERDKDDLVLSVGLACWYGERAMRRPDVWFPRG